MVRLRLSAMQAIHPESAFCQASIGLLSDLRLYEAALEPRSLWPAPLGYLAGTAGDLAVS